MVKNPFAAARFTLNNANRHIDQFLIGRALFLGNSKHAHIVDDQSIPGQKIYKIGFATSIPFELNSIALDAVTNIRDVLDNAVYASVVASGVRIRRLRKIKFPFGDTVDQVSSEIRANVDLNANIADIIRGFHPEAGAENSLWTINHLANAKKHRWNLTPFPIFAGKTEITINSAIPTDKLAITGLGNRWDGDKNELSYLTVSADSVGNFQTNTAVDISFNEPPSIAKVGALCALRQFSNEAEGVLMAIEAESRRLGWIS